MQKHYCSNCFQINYAKERGLSGVCPHCKYYVLMAKNIKDAKIIYRTVKKYSEESRKMIDNETKKLLYGSFFRGTIVQKKAYDEEITGEFKSKDDIDKFFLEKYNV